MTTHTTYPLSLGAVSPGEGFTRMTMPLSPSGYPEGQHTGGPFLAPDGLTVWKPLDCLTYPNSECRHPTAEAVVLELVAGQPCFPRNWQTCVQNGRQWLVRPRLKVYGQDLDITLLDRELVRCIELAVRALNESHWQICDDLVIAQDIDGQPFILDLSNVQFMGRPDQAWEADDASRVLELMTQAGHGDLATLRQQGCSVYHAAPSGSRSRHPHVYHAAKPLTDSELLELSRVTSSVRGQRRAQGREALAPPDTTPFIQTSDRLPETVAATYGLEWAYSPLHHQPRHTPIPIPVV